MKRSDRMRRVLAVLIIVGLMGTVSAGYADEKYVMWMSLKSSSSTKTDWKKLHNFSSLSKCQTCLLGNRELAIEAVLEKPVRDLGHGGRMQLSQIVRHGDYAFTVYWQVPWGTENDRWEFRCYPSTYDPRK